MKNQNHKVTRIPVEKFCDLNLVSIYLRFLEKAILLFDGFQPEF